MKIRVKLIILFFIAFIYFGFGHAFAEKGDVELVLTDIWLDPPNPQAGEKVAIKGNVYNAGIYDLEYRASVVTVGFFIDGELRKITELGNVKTGFGRSVTITTGPFWDAEWGEHTFEIIVDYHDTLSDYEENPDNNTIKKKLNIIPALESGFVLSLDPQYILPGKNQLITIKGALIEKISERPIKSQNILLKIGSSEIALITDKEGKFSITKALTTQDKVEVSVLYDGNFPYLKVNRTIHAYNLPQTSYNSGIVWKLIDHEGQYNFANLNSEIVVFQDSYDTTLTKIQTSKKDTLLDNVTAWTGLPGGHSYLEEVYVGGRFFFATDWTPLPENRVIQKNLIVPETAQIRFHVIDERGNPLVNAKIKNWIYTTQTDSEGFTEWIEILPTRTKDEPYILSITTLSGKSLKSDPFFVTSGEKKILEVIAKEGGFKIPQWVRNTAEWWASDQISDKDFVEGLQYLMQQRIIVVPNIERASTPSEETIPSWIKRNAEWWSEGHLSDGDFVSAIQYLIKIGIIRI